MPEAQVDEDVVIGDGMAIPQMRALDAERDGLAVDALDGGAFPIQGFVEVALAVKLVAEPCPDASEHHGRMPTFFPLRVADGARLAGGLKKEQRTNVLAAFMLH